MAAVVMSGKIDYYFYRRFLGKTLDEKKHKES